MYKRSVMAALVCALASASSEDAPQVSLSVPPPFATDVTVKHYRQGQDLLDDPTFHLITVAPLTVYHGWFGPRGAQQARIHVYLHGIFESFCRKAEIAGISRN